ncbi:hypothetical protein DFJ73DRAFT_943803 [Zopfochytrium polystomum]|nr:hypothetical protein DFJ73DRAFT_943803 [Zopfochytrium polystomum]
MQLQQQQLILLLMHLLRLHLLLLQQKQMRQPPLNGKFGSMGSPNRERSITNEFLRILNHRADLDQETDVVMLSLDHSQPSYLNQLAPRQGGQDTRAPWVTLPKVEVLIKLGVQGAGSGQVED